MPVPETAPDKRALESDVSSSWHFTRDGSEAAMVARSFWMLGSGADALSRKFRALMPTMTTVVYDGRSTLTRRITVLVRPMSASSLSGVGGMVPASV